MSVHRYLITGAAGFIGSRVAELLLRAGHAVVGIDNLNDAYDLRLKEWRLTRLTRWSKFLFRRRDITDREGFHSEMDALMYDVGYEPFDAVINLAARAGVRYSVENPWSYVDTNITGTLNLLELCRRRGVRKFVLASSSSVYGASTSLPYAEDADTNQPLSPYAASKRAAESLCYSYHHLHKIDVTVLRYFTVYGPAGRPDMSPFRFVQRISEGRPITIFGDGEQSRDFTYVDDIARGTVSALRPLGFEIINLGSDRPVSVNAMIGLIAELVGRGAVVINEPPHAADVRATWANIDKARSLLGWQPSTTFRDGMRALVAWYAQNRRWCRDIRTA